MQETSPPVRCSSNIAFVLWLSGVAARLSYVSPSETFRLYPLHSLPCPDAHVFASVRDVESSQPLGDGRLWRSVLRGMAFFCRQHH